MLRSDSFIITPAAWCAILESCNLSFSTKYSRRVRVHTKTSVYQTAVNDTRSKLTSNSTSRYRLCACVSLTTKLVIQHNPSRHIELRCFTDIDREGIHQERSRAKNLLRETSAGKEPRRGRSEALISVNELGLQLARFGDSLATLQIFSRLEVFRLVVNDGFSGDCRRCFNDQHFR